MNDSMRVVLDAYLRDPKAFWAAVAEIGEESTLSCFGEAKIGDVILIRSVTFHYIGKLTRVTGAMLTLRDVRWINTTGPWEEFLNSTNSAGDLEAYRKDDYVMVAIAAIVDVSPAPSFAQ